MITIERGRPASEYPTPEQLSEAEVRAILDPDAKDVPEVRANRWLAEETQRLQALIDGPDPRDAAFSEAQLAFHLSMREPSRAHGLAMSALRAGRELADPEVEAFARLSLGWAIWNRDNDIKAAGDEAAEAEYLFHEAGRPVGEATGMLSRFFTLGFSGAYSRAAAMEDSFWPLLEAPAEDPYEQIRLRTLATLHRSLAWIGSLTGKDRDLVTRLLALATLYARAAPEPILVHYHQNELGGLYLQDGDWAEARRCYRRAALIARRNDAPLCELNMLHFLAHTYIGEKEFAAAEDLIREAEERATMNLAVPRLQRLVLQGSRMDLLLTQERWDEAEALINGIMPDIERSPRVNIVRVLKQLVRIYREQGTLGEHLDVYDRLLEETERLADERSAVQLGAAETNLKAERRKVEQRAHRILRGILPENVFQEVVEHGESAPRFFPPAVVFFSDFAGFTKIASALTPRQVIEELSDLFGHFDEIMRQHGCDRIETIGDAYLAVAGLREGADLSGNAVRMAQAALAIQEYLAERNRLAGEVGGSRFIARIGIHAGPIIGGIVGRERIRYGIFGDTVNTAQRLEAACEPGNILVSAPVRDAINGAAEPFELVQSETITPKGKGSIKTWEIRAQHPH
jgi:class 3 adenylate cyclase